MSLVTSTPEISLGAATNAEIRRPATDMIGTIGLVLAVLVLIIASIGMVYLLALAINWYKTPFLGAVITDSLSVNSNDQPLTSTGWNGFQAGLHANDQIVAITAQNGQSLHFDPNAQGVAQQLNDFLASLSRGQVVQVEIQRVEPVKVYDPACAVFTTAGADCTYNIVLDRMPLIDFLAQFGVGFLVSLIALGLGIGTLLVRPRESASRWLAVLCASGAIVFAGRFETTTTYQIAGFWILALCGVGAGEIGLVMSFPYKLTAFYQRSWLRFFPTLISLLFCVLCLVIYAEPQSRPYGTAQILAGLFGLVSGIALLWSMASRRIYSPSPINREQAGLVMVGILVAIAPSALWIVSLLLNRAFGWDWLTFPAFYTYPPLLVFPLSVVYAMFQTRLVNSDRVIMEGAIYTALGATLVIGYSLITFALYLLTGGQIRWDSPVPVALIVFGIALLFTPARRRLERLVDDAFFKQRRAYETRLERFARKLAQLLEITDVAREVQTQLDETITPQYIFAFVRNMGSGEYEAVPDAATGKPKTDLHFSPGSPLLNYLGGQGDVLYLMSGQPLPVELASERARLAVLNTPVIARMHSSNRLNGFLAIGPRRDRTRYSFEDLRFIESLAAQSALAIERAQVIVEAQRNERELKVLSQVSAALNITMDFNTLLEFIYTQTSKLIRAHYFYIALRVSGTNEMQFVFYLENDERIAEREERVRWPLGQDLFTEVMRTQRPLKLEAYYSEVQRRALQPILENPAIHSWAAVPLNAGTGDVLGVIAIADTDPAFTYSEDQLRIFSSISEIAAAALDKARLFRETEQRARQLSVLNNISERLASAFESVDKLLGIIMQSAVEILSAEAGSLLLREQTTGDLVFTLAIGGAGEHLVGTHIPAGTGIAGKVVETGQPVIVNDTANDSTWFGDVQSGSRKGRDFRTNAIVAVPLIARGSVIGVLEVINKRDRTQFVQTEVDLLATFASQAAIAIENARLFQMTDQQLEARVEQMGNMQRIDQELNRTLDVHSVVTLTLDNALRESSADAGALAVVRHEPLGFEIVGSMGYPSGMFTPREIYPIDLGVIGRVFRTGQPSIVTNLADDTDYIETLPGAVGQIAVPMIAAGREVTAVLLLETRMPSAFNMMTMSFITALAEHANTAITNSRLFEQLQRANEARTQFVGFVAHELKTPMTSMKGYVEAMLSGMTGSMSDQQKNALDIVQRNVVRMQQIIEDLRDVTALETGQLAVTLQPTSFNSVVLETLRPQQRAISNKQQTLVMDVPEDLPLIMGDGNRLIQVLTNFISNANKYTPEGGTVRISAEAVANRWDLDGAPQVIHCWVQDTGYGMDEDDLKKLSTPYFRSENPLTREQPGTGLGMTITYALVEAHHGHVWVESEVNKGTTFHFTVPVAAIEEKAH
ncbi:MAG: GAF domain-containing protein [Aggregatilineales bacterium]